MGRQRTGNDRSLLDGHTSGGRATGGHGSDGGSTVDTGRETTTGVWDTEILGGDQDDEEPAEPATVVTVDRDKLTDRQLEVLETAYEMGYYEYPRGANASEVAEALDICPSTLAEHLAAAQTKLLDDILPESES